MSQMTTLASQTPCLGTQTREFITRPGNRVSFFMRDWRPAERANST